MRRIGIFALTIMISVPLLSETAGAQAPRPQFQPQPQLTDTTAFLAFAGLFAAIGAIIAGVELSKHNPRPPIRVVQPSPPVSAS